MTFRIDTIALEGAGPGRWACSFKGFRGQGVYGRALLDDSRIKLVLESTMDASERLVVPIGATPIFVNNAELHAWIAEHRIHELGLIDRTHTDLRPKIARGFIRIGLQYRFIVRNERGHGR